MKILKTLRKSRGFTQEYLAQLLNIGWRSIGQYERPDAPIPWDKARKLAEIFNVDIDCFFSEKNYPRRRPQKTIAVTVDVPCEKLEDFRTLLQWLK